jgi:excinuclease ABC subunit C
MRLRDEAHRFAISYHRLLRKKALTRSILEEAPGVGPKRRQRLLAAFGSLAALKKANAAEIVEKAGLDQGTAAALEAFLAALDTT